MTIEVKAVSRNAQGTGASRRLRHTGRALGVVYGLGDAVSIEMDHNEIYHTMRVEEFHASVVNLNLDGKVEPVMLRAFQMHPFRQQVLHIDFLRVDMAKPMHIKVPLHFINADIAPGVKTGGGKITHVMNELDVTCLPADLPGFVEVDLAKLEVGHSIHVADLTMPKGVTVSAHGRHTGELVVATIYVPRAAEVTAAPAADAKAAKKGKK
ncbi:MAG: 50S ribosomal protein L25/general stress protein Ctc [Gallionella sp.]|nr:50S ribosomal protein L25/general stress protein Ctc [Gallionella sp.]MDD4957900.1 50S ribosomal protein L25/general stress protein Ctc [Gallionella sp.]